MLRFLLALLCWLTLSPAWGATSFYWRAEGTTLDATADYNPNNSTEAATVNATPSISGTAACAGSNGILVDSAGDYYAFDSATTNMNGAAGAVGFCIRIQTFTDGAHIWTGRTNSASANDFVRVQMSTVTNNHLRLNIRNSGVGAQTWDCTVALSNDTTYFVIFMWDQSASDRRCEVYDSGGSAVSGSPVEDLTTGWTSPATGFPITDGLFFGESAGAATAYYLDNIFVASAYADGATIYCNRNITTYANYAACGSGAVNYFSWRLRVN